MALALSVLSDGSIQRGQIFRFLSDGEFGEIRGMAGESTPATTRLYREMDDDTSGSFNIPPRFDIFLRSQNSAIAYQYLVGLHGGWSNQHPYPTVELLTFQGNQFIGERINADWTKVYCYKSSDTPMPNPYYQPTWYNIHLDGRLTPGKTFADQARIVIMSDTGWLFVQSFKVRAI